MLQYADKAAVVLQNVKGPLALTFVENWSNVWAVSFASALQMDTALEFTALATHPAGLAQGCYTVPEALCKGDRARLPCSAMMAVFDELSTLALVLGDRKVRPGVSVAMNCSLLQPIYAGERLLFTSRAVKVGSVLGFGSTVVYKENSPHVVVARGFQSKYLPMGRAWDLMTSSPMLSPLVRYNLVKDLDKRLKAVEKRNRKHSKDGSPNSNSGIKLEDEPQASIEGSLWKDMFALQDFTISESWHDVLVGEQEEDDSEASAGSGGGGGDAHLRRERQRLNETQQRLKYNAAFEVKPWHHNYLGGGHGGAVGMLAEQLAATGGPPPSPTSPQRPHDDGAWVSSIDAQFMAPSNGPLFVQGLTLAGGATFATSKVNVSDAKGRPTATAHLVWGGSE